MKHRISTPTWNPLSKLRMLLSVAFVLSMFPACGGGSSGDVPVLGLLGLATGGTATHQTTQSVSAYLTDDEGVPVADTTLTFQTMGGRSVTGERVATATTDSDGLFSVLLAPQTYAVTAGTLSFELIVYTNGDVAAGTDGVLVSRERRDPPLRLVAGGNRAVDEGTTATIEVRLRYRPHGPVTFAVQQGRAAGGAAGLHITPSTLEFRPSNFDEPQTIHITSASDARVFDRPVEVLLSPEGSDETLPLYALFYDTDAPDLSGYDVQVAGASGQILSPRIETRAAFNPVGERVVAFARTATPPEAFAFDCDPGLTACTQNSLAGGDDFGWSPVATRRHVYDALTDRMIFFQAGSRTQSYMRCDADGTNCDSPVVLRNDTAYSSYEGAEMFLDPLDRKLVIIVSDWSVNASTEAGYMVVYRCDVDNDRCSLRTLPSDNARRFAAVLDERDRKLFVASYDNPGPVLSCNVDGSNCAGLPALQYVTSAALDRKNDRLLMSGFRTNYSTGEEFIAQRICARNGSQCDEVVIGPLPVNLHHRYGLWVPQISRMVYALAGFDRGDGLYSCNAQGEDCHFHDLRGPDGTAPIYAIWNLTYDPGTAQFYVGAELHSDTTILRIPVAP